MATTVKKTIWNNMNKINQSHLKQTNKFNIRYAN